jgi:hypothetical protein
MPARLGAVSSAAAKRKTAKTKRAGANLIECHKERCARLGGGEADQIGLAIAPSKAQTSLITG